MSLIKHYITKVEILDNNECNKLFGIMTETMMCMSGRWEMWGVSGWLLPPVTVVEPATETVAAQPSWSRRTDPMSSYPHLLSLYFAWPIVSGGNSVLRSPGWLREGLPKWSGQWPHRRGHLCHYHHPDVGPNPQVHWLDPVHHRYRLWSCVWLVLDLWNGAAVFRCFSCGFVKPCLSICVSAKVQCVSV